MAPAGSGSVPGSGSGSGSVPQPAGLARLAAMASSQQKMLSSAGHKVSVVQPTAEAGPEAQLLHAEHGEYEAEGTGVGRGGRRGLPGGFRPAGHTPRHLAATLL